MTNTEKLKDAISRSGLKLDALMAAANIKSYATLRLKINNDSEFTAREISALADLLHLTADERDQIFFAVDAE